MSLRFSADLRSRVKRYARSRGLEEATAVRTLCAERLQELELSEDLLLADRWQLGQSLESWSRLQSGQDVAVAPDLVRQLFARARRGT